MQLRADNQKRNLETPLVQNGHLIKARGQDPGQKAAVPKWFVRGD